jgi:ParB-like chromosome segregation protein Spo0J
MRIALNTLDAHPGNANVMPEHLLAKLAAHIGESGLYPPLIVRPSPAGGDRYEILDGHHRAAALRRLGRDHAECEVWHVDDARARMLLLTLNRLQGSDDPLKRGELLRRLADSLAVEVGELAEKLPDDVARITKLIALTRPPAPPAPPRPLAGMPQAVTFFLTAGQRSALLAKLDAIGADRSAALAKLLELGS